MKKLLPGILLVVISLFVADRLFPQIRMKQLTVVTIPSGALVFVNGVPAGMSPLTQFVPLTGSFIEVEKNGYFASDSLIDSPADTMFLQLNEGCLLIVKTTPPGCQIISSGFSGISPCSLVVESGNQIEITALGSMGISVTRSVNLLTPGTRLVEVTVPFEFTDDNSGLDFTVIPRDLLPFAMGPLTIGRYEVTASQFAEFMNAVDSDLTTDSDCLYGRTCLMDSVLKCNWRGPVGFNSDTTAYAPLEGMRSHPMVGVTRGGAEWYCEWLSSLSSCNLEFRLADCDEWSTIASAGSQLDVNLSDVNEILLNRHPEIDDGWAETAPAGSMGQSEWGLYEMQGNVWEWTSSEGTAMGGSWLSSLEDCTAQSRIVLGDNLGYPFVGFRVVASGFPMDIIETQ